MPNTILTKDEGCTPEDPLLCVCVKYVNTYGIQGFIDLVASIRQNPVHDKKSHILQQAKEVFKGTISINGNSEENPFIERFASEAPDPLDIITRTSSEETLHTLIKKLGPEEQDFVCRRFGLYRYEQAPLHAVCKNLNVTIGRGRRIEKKAIERLRGLMDENHLTADCF